MYKKLTTKFCRHALFYLPLKRIFMRLIVILLVVGMHVSVFAHAQKVTLNRKDASLAAILKEIKRQTGYHFLYDADAVHKAPKVTLDVQSTHLKEVLDHCLKDLPLQYVIKGKNVIISKKGSIQNSPTPSTEIEQQRTITGTVRNEKGEPISGVTVKVENTNQQTQTDSQGQFLLDIDQTAKTLSFSNVGYDAYYHILTNINTINVVLKNKITALDELVVVGYGTASRKNITTAVSSIKPENISKAAVSNVSSLLLGRAAGVQATISSPQPDGNVNVSIRGGGTPLYVIDGVVMPSGSLEAGAGRTNVPSAINRSGLGGLNPEDIESIEILKDASASIYGIGAANGVVLITTKKGKNGNPTLTYDGSYSISANTKLIDILNAEQYMQVKNVFSKELYLYDNGMGPYGENPYDGLWTPKYTAEVITNNIYDIDWIGEVFRHGRIHNQNLTYSGGSDKVQYYVSGNYFDQQATVQNSDMQRYVFRSNLGAQLFPRVRLTTTLNYNQNRYGNSTVGSDPNGGHTYGAYQAAISYSPLLPIETHGVYSTFSNIPNPVALKEISDKTKVNTIYGNFALDVDVLKNILDAKLIYGLNKESSDRGLYIPSYLYYDQMYRSRGNLGSAARTRQTMEALLNFRKRWAGVSLEALAGIGRYLESFDGFNIYYENTNDQIANDAIQLSAGPYYPTSYKGANEKRSQFVRATIDVLDRYVVNGSLRRDGTDKFFPGKKYTLFPSASLAWKVSNESFLQNTHWIDLLKLRLSYGVTGRDNLGSSLYGLYSTSSYINFDNGDTQYIPYLLTGRDYDDVSWERTEMKNIGIDFTFWNNRVSGSLDMFRNDETGLLNYDPESWLSMFGTRPINGGHYKREGIELNVTLNNIKNKIFEWSSLVNLSRSVRTWVERAPNYDYKVYQLRKNEPYDNYYYYKHIGIINSDRSNMPESQKSLATAAQMPGYPIIDDKNGDGVIDQQDVYVDNDGDPKLYAGFGNTFRYKKFDLDIFMYGRFGIRKWNHGLAYGNPSSLISIDRNIGTSIFEAYSSLTNLDGTRPGVAFWLRNPALPEGLGVDMDVRDASFLRVRNIQLGYNLNGNDSKILRKILKQARVYFDVQNPIIFTKYAIIDPEIVTGGGQSSMVSFPQARTFSVGLKVSL